MWKKIVERAMIITGHRPAVDRANLDAFRSSVLLKCYEWHMQPQHLGTGIQPTKEDAANFYGTAEQMEFDDMREYTQEQLNKQIIHMFTRIEENATWKHEGIKAKDKNGSKSKSDDKENESNNNAAVSPSSSGSSKVPQPQPVTTAEFNLSALMKSIGFRVESKPSTCPGDSGRGLFLACPQDAIIPAGTLLALYPGLVHLPEYTTKPGYIRSELLPDPNLMLMLRTDNTVIDGRTAHKCPANPYALAHMVNHVPLGLMPNVLQCPYNFPGDPIGKDVFPTTLQKFIPNSYGLKTPTLFGTIDRSAMMRTVVLLAARPLKNGDELFMDYRLNPSAGSLPSWYSPYGREEGEGEEKKDKVKEKESLDS
jgi:hypothetical protein